MTESERIARLTAVLHGTGATVNDAFGIWALHSDLSDKHIAELAGWADLQYLVADSTRITDASIPVILGFTRLTDLSIGGNIIASSTLSTCTLPSEISNLGLGGIPLTDEDVSTISRCSEITALNVNYCQLSSIALEELARLPKLRSIEALGADSTLEMTKHLSERHPDVLFRLREGVWQHGKRLRPPFPSEMA
jgi:Leucine-rich repeat (LRR) protein